MNKAILFFVIIAISVLNLNALDITTTDGTVYKNVEVTNVLPDAVGFMYTKKDGANVLRDVKMTLLTKDLQKKFNYSPKKAKIFKKQVAYFQAERAQLAQKQHKEDLVLFRKHKAISNDLNQIKAMLRAHEVKCWINITRNLGEDCIGKMIAPYSTGKFGHLGAVYVRNLTGSQNARIAVTIYPTGKNKSFEDGTFPVYNANLDKCALELLKKHENSTLGSPAAGTNKNMIFPGNTPQKKK